MTKMGWEIANFISNHQLAFTAVAVAVLLLGGFFQAFVGLSSHLEERWRPPLYIYTQWASEAGRVHYVDAGGVERVTYLDMGTQFHATVERERPHEWPKGATEVLVNVSPPPKQLLESRDHLPSHRPDTPPLVLPIKDYGQPVTIYLLLWHSNELLTEHERIQISVMGGRGRYYFPVVLGKAGVSNQGWRFNKIAMDFADVEHWMDGRQILVSKVPRPQSKE